MFSWCGQGYSTVPDGPLPERSEPGALRNRSKSGDLNQAYDDRQVLLGEQVWFEKNHPDSEFFTEIFIDKQGGFTEVNDLWYEYRWVETTATISMILCNLVFIVYIDVQEIYHTRWHFDTEVERKDDFLLTRIVTDPIISGVAMASGSDKFWSSGHAMPCCLELIGLALLLKEVVEQMVKSRLASSSEYSRWFSAQRIYFTLIPQLYSYSAMRLLHFITPPVLMDDIYKWYVYSQERWVGHDGNRVLVRRWLELILTRILCFVIGVDVFLTKCRQSISRYMLGQLAGWKMIAILIFLMQVLGIVQMRHFVRSRLFTFIFAGEDSVMQPRETAMKNVWSAKLTKCIWEHYPWPKYVSIMLTFSNEDFQRLVLNEAWMSDCEELSNDAPLAREESEQTRRKSRRASMSFAERRTRRASLLGRRSSMSRPRRVSVELGSRAPSVLSRDEPPRISSRELRAGIVGESRTTRLVL